MALIEVGNGLLYPALRKAGVTLGPGRTPSAAQFQDAIDELNRLLGSLHCDPYFVFGLDVLTFPLVAGQKVYTIGVDPTGGPDADVPFPAPNSITFANYLSGTPVLRSAVDVFTAQQWASVELQDTGATIPTGIYYDRDYPIGKLYVYGQPPGDDLELYVWRDLVEISTPADEVQLPPGYEDVLVLQLACRLAPQFGKQLDPLVLQQARESLMRVESINAPRPIADTSGLSSGGGYNIYTDQ